MVSRSGQSSATSGGNMNHYEAIHDNDSMSDKYKANLTSEQQPQVGLKYDTGKLLFSLIPPETTRALAQVLTFGAQKYAPNNWQLVENGKDRYLDALFRHLDAYRSGEALDPESGLSHLSHALTNVAFLHYLDLKANQ